LSSAIAAILEQPDVQERARTLSAEPDYEDEATPGKYLAAESVELKEVIKSLPPP
jgi:hypothetical protein